MRFCPYCSGTGTRDEGRECPECEGSGNLFGVFVRAAYRLGQEDGLRKLRSVHAAAEHALTHAATDGDDMRALLVRLGV